jgi:hypothetical protein
MAKTAANPSIAYRTLGVSFRPDFGRGNASFSV